MKKTLLFLSILLLVSFTFVSAQKKKLTFNADMRIEVLKGTFDPTKDVVTVPGGFNNWLNEPPANSTKIMTDDDKDYIYTLSYDVDPGNYDYKFNIGTGWEGKDEPGENSKVTVGTSDVTVTRFFKGKAYSKVPTEVTFKVDMTLPIKTGFNPASGKVYVAGNFTDWGSGAIEMTGPDSKNIYTVKVSKTSSGADIMSGDLLI